MRAIRRGVFETNSSSTHSITMCSKEDYDKWLNGELLFADYWRSDKTFITRDEAIERLKNDKYGSYKDLDYDNNEDVNEAFKEEEIYTYEEYWSDDLESFHDEYTTPDGSTVVAFGEYGYRG